MKKVFWIPLFLAMAAGTDLATPTPVAAQQGCADCIDIGMCPCAACVYTAIYGYFVCIPRCNVACACETSSGNPDCVFWPEEDQLMALATRTYHASGPGAERPSLPGVTAGVPSGSSSLWERLGYEDAAQDAALPLLLPRGVAGASKDASSLWVDLDHDETAHDVKRTCNGYVLVQRYSEAASHELARSLSRLVM